MSFDTDPSSEWVQQHLPCSDCGSTDGLSINDRGWSKCFVCGKSRRVFENEDASVPASRKTKIADYNFLDGLTFDGLPKRGINAETCRKWGYGVGKNKRGVWVQVAQHYKDGTLVAQKLRDTEKNFTWLGDVKAVEPLYGMRLWPAKGKMVVITEGELDALSVSQLQDNKWPVVSVCNGAQTAHKEVAKALEWLNGFEKVVLMMDDDEPGRAAAQACAAVLPPGKAFIAKLPMKDANACLMDGKGKDVLTAIWNAAPWRPDAVLSGADIWDRIRNYKGPVGEPWPWKHMDGLLPLMPHPAIITCLAGSGSGKSTVCRAIEHHLIVRGQNVGALHLEESAERTAIGIVGYEMGKRLDVSMKGVDPGELERAYAETAGRDGVFYYDSFGSVDPDTIISKIRYLVKACGCRYVVLDHLSIVLSGLDVANERQAIDQTMTKLRQLVQELDFCLFLVCHLKKSSGSKPHEEGGEVSLQDARGSHAIVQLSDLVLGFERNQQADDEAERNRITVRVLKNRQWGSTGPACRLVFDTLTGRLLDYPKDYGDDPADEFEKGTAPVDGETVDAF